MPCVLLLHVSFPLPLVQQQPYVLVMYLIEGLTCSQGEGCGVEDVTFPILELREQLARGKNYCLTGQMFPECKLIDVFLIFLKMLNALLSVSLKCSSFGQKSAFGH